MGLGLLRNGSSGLYAPSSSVVKKQHEGKEKTRDRPNVSWPGGEKNHASFEQGGEACLCHSVSWPALLHLQQEARCAQTHKRLLSCICPALECHKTKTLLDTHKRQGAPRGALTCKILTQTTLPFATTGVIVPVPPISANPTFFGPGSVLPILASLLSVSVSARRE